MTASSTRSTSNTEHARQKPYSSHDCPAFQRVRQAGPAQMNRTGRKWPRQRRHGRYSQSRDLLDAEDTLHAHLQKGEDLGADQQVSYQLLISRKSNVGTRACKADGLFPL
ncbi:hypothetical protein GGD64_007174 [Bradyrhizobium sp. CIR3A]|nr:hypothetical protein [Bradyrhizobium sp. CIR3A]